jgi:DNA-binding transcriptional LysR family regulator
MKSVHIDAVDLNLLRLFDAVYRTRNVSRAAELLDLTQPAASQGLTRLRTADPGPAVHARRRRRGAHAQGAAAGGAGAAGAGHAGAGAGETRRLRARAGQPQAFHIHMSDIGESRFLPELMVTRCASRRRACGWRPCRCRATDHRGAGCGRIDFAFGFLPMVKDTQRLQLLKDRYVVLLRAGHPFARKRRSGKALLEALRELEFVGVRSHADTLRIVQQLQLETGCGW